MIPPPLACQSVLGCERHRVHPIEQPYSLNLVAALNGAGVAVAIGGGGGHGASDGKGNEEKDDSEDGSGGTSEHCV